MRAPSRRPKVLFAHDHRFIPSGNAVLTDTQFDRSLWMRYLEHFDSVTVVARRTLPDSVANLSTMQVSSMPGVTFEFVPDLSTFRGLTVKRRQAANRMKHLVESVDAVIARLPSEVGLLAVSAAQRQRTPWSVEIVDCPWDGLWHYGTLKAKAYAPIAFVRMRQAIAKAPFAMYVTSEFLQQRYPNRVGVVGSASNVQLPVVDPGVLDVRLARLNEEWSLARPVRLGLIGTLRARFKGIQTVLQALAHVRDSLPPVTFHVLGGGDVRPWRQLALSYGVADIVTFDGTLPSGPSVMRWLDAIDIYLQPSFKEGLPRALIEAMSRGCPALATRVAGIPELLPSEDLVPSGNAKALSALLLERVADVHWMRTRAIRNWQTAQRYEAERLAAQRYSFWSRFSEEVARTKRC